MRLIVHHCVIVLRCFGSLFRVELACDSKFATAEVLCLRTAISYSGQSITTGPIDRTLEPKANLKRRGVDDTLFVPESHCYSIPAQHPFLGIKLKLMYKAMIFSACCKA